MRLSASSGHGDPWAGIGAAAWEEWTRSGARGAPGTARSGDVSKSATKASRGGIDGEKKRGISTILLAHSGAIGAFAADSGKRRRGPREGPTGRAAAGDVPAPPPRFASIAHLVWWDGVSHAVTRPGSRDRHLTREHVTQPARSPLNPRARLPEVRARGLSDVLGGYPAISRTAAAGADPPRTPRRALRARERRSDRRDPTAHKRSAQESTAMSPLNNLPGEPHWPPGSRADRIPFNRARRSGRSSTAVTTRISMSVDQ